MKSIWVGKETKDLQRKTKDSNKLKDRLFKWSLKRSLTLMVLNSRSCCAGHLEDLKTAQLNQLSSIVTQNPGRANVLILCGAITHRMGPVIRQVYDQMEKPNWVIALGSCASGGGMMHYSYSIVRDLRTIIPVDVFVPGCPVSRDSLISALNQIVQKSS